MRDLAGLALKRSSLRTASTDSPHDFLVIDSPSAAKNTKKGKRNRARHVSRETRETVSRVALSRAPVTFTFSPSVTTDRRSHTGPQKKNKEWPVSREGRHEKCAPQGAKVTVCHDKGRQAVRFHGASGRQERSSACLDVLVTRALKRPDDWPNRFSDTSVLVDLGTMS